MIPNKRDGRLNVGYLGSAGATAFLDMGEVSPNIHEALLPDRDAPISDRFGGRRLLRNFPSSRRRPTSSLDPVPTTATSTWFSRRHVRRQILDIRNDGGDAF